MNFQDWADLIEYVLRKCARARAASEVSHFELIRSQRTEGSAIQLT